MTKSEFMTRLDKALSKLSEQERGDILNDYEEHFRIGAEQGKPEEEIAASLGSPEELAASYTDTEPVQAQADAGQGQPQQEPQPAQQASAVPPGQPAAGAGYYTQEPGRQPEYTAPSGRGGYAPPPPQYGYPQYGQVQQPGAPYYTYPPQTYYAVRSPGERAAWTVIMVCLTLFIVLPVGGGIALGLWFVILGLGIAAGAVAIAMFVASVAGIGFFLLGIGAVCLCVALIFGLISYTGGAVKIFRSYFRMCSAVINGRRVAWQ